MPLNSLAIVCTSYYFYTYNIRPKVKHTAEKCMLTLAFVLGVTSEQSEDQIMQVQQRLEYIRMDTFAGVDLPFGSQPRAIRSR
jgi:hypothetical protein